MHKLWKGKRMNKSEKKVYMTLTLKVTRKDVAEIVKQWWSDATNVTNKLFDLILNHNAINNLNHIKKIAEDCEDKCDMCPAIDCKACTKQQAQAILKIINKELK